MKTVKKCVKLGGTVGSLLALFVWHPDKAFAGHPNPLRPFTAQQLADIQKSDELDTYGQEAIDAKNFVAAENDFRAALKLEPQMVGIFRGLAEALAGQGRAEQAMEAYRRLIYPQDPNSISSVADEMRTRMGYAILLSKTGQWSEAVAVYKKALSEVSFGTDPKINAQFDTQYPQPLGLQADAHIVIGREYFGHAEFKKAFMEYDQGRQLAPDDAVTNYYFGQGWQTLDPKDKAKYASPQQAKAALQKAVKLGKGDVKLAAAKALKSFS